MKRPDFKDIKTFEEFNNYYWYREELIALCKELGIEYIGNKSELLNIVHSYYNGKLIPHKAKPSTKRQNTELALNTKLLEFGFACRNEYRDFFAKHTGNKNFHYTADMASAIKKMRQEKDINFTAQDLINVYLGKSNYAKYDSSSCQWNKYLKDFCADEYNNKFKNKLQTASAFWKLLRSSTLPKIYTREFIIENKKKIKASVN